MSYVSVATCEPQLAFAIGRRFGSAVERNRARRRLRAAFISAWRSSPTPAPGAYLVTADRSVLTSGFDRLVTALQRCLDQAAVRSSIATSGEAT
jgi:ribonuclease P protein component